MGRILILIGFLILGSYTIQAQTIADFSVNKDTFCVGDTLFLTDLSSTSSGTITSWHWNLAGSPSSSLQNPNYIILPYHKGNLLISLYINTSSGDSAYISKTIFAKYVNAGPDQLICVGDTVHLSAIGQNIQVWDWSPSASLSCVNCPDPIASPIVNTYYTVTATDDEGCIHQDSVLVEMKDNPVITTPSQSVCDSSLSLIATPSGGTWSGTGVDLNGYFNPFIAGVGEHWIYYGFSCGNPDSVLLTVGGLIQPYFSVTLDSCSKSNGSIIIDSIQGGYPPFSYNWSDGSTSKDLLNKAAGEFFVTITDFAGCKRVYGQSITPYPNAMIGVSGTCIGEPFSLHANPMNQDTSNYSIQWLPSANAVNDTAFNTIGYINQSGAVGFIITDTVGCATTITSTINALECVWPGDANYDGVANNFDILNIGIAYGSTGRSRDTTVISWTPQISSNWSQSFADGTNYKHADCNGDSTINSLDTVAVSLNYGLTHQKKFSTGGVADPPLFIDQPDTIYPGQLVEAPIIFGDMVNVALDAYGVAFTVLYDNSDIDSGSFHLISSSSWMGTLGTDLLKFEKDNYQNGTFDVAYVRTNQQNIPNGFGQIGKLGYILQDDISGKKAAEKPFILSVVNIKAISMNESLIEVNGLADTATILYSPIGIPKVGKITFKLYPIPVSGEWLNFETDEKISKVEIFDVSGKLIQELNMPDATNGKINVSYLDNGIYILKAHNNSSSVVHKFIMNR